ncbi:MAG: ATP synthase subunit a [candidate division TM6 bacterium GW2011_GWF2_37_49]|nr:MAG: ATP synthase subunit a [candidate division TM6 bacterium GW2011_GWF2_37_49]
MSLNLFDHTVIKPFASLGYTDNFWNIHLDTIIFTWGGMFCLFILCIICRYFIKKDLSLTGTAVEQGVGALMGMITESFKSFDFNYFCFISTVFLFTFFSCVIGIIPFMDEATKDLNTTLAIGSISFFYVQYQKVRVVGIKGFVHELCEPIFLLFPVNVVGELAKIASMSFRLFGNILGGGIIFAMLLQMLNYFNAYFISFVLTFYSLAILVYFSRIQVKFPFLVKFVKFGMNVAFLIAFAQIFFGIFEGLIQAFVITMLTTTYLAIGVQHEEAHEDGHKKKEDENLTRENA